MFRICSSVTLALMVGAQAHVRADVRITETTSATAGNRQVEGQRTTYIKGAQMRLEIVQPDQSTTTLYDVPGGTTIVLNAGKKRAELRDMSARNAVLEREYPRARTTVSLTPTAARQELVGTSCDEYAFSIRVPMTKDGSIAVLMTGSAWVAKEAPGAADYALFAKAAIERQVVLGPASNNYILLSIIRAQTELYRALGELGGIPYFTTMTIKGEGRGMVAGMVKKLVSGTRMSTVTNVEFAPLSDALFVIPDGWKRERK